MKQNLEQQEKEPTSPQRRAWSGGLWRHVAAVLVLFWLALVYLNYYPQFYAPILGLYALSRP